MKLTRAQRDILWSDFRADDSGRATALGHWFAVADIAYHADPDAVPHAWRFGHGASGRDCLADMLACGHHGECECDWRALDYLPYADYPPALAYAGEVLSRYRRRWLCDTCETRRSECSCD